MDKIIQYLKIYGKGLDTEISEAVGISLSMTRQHLLELTEKMEVMSCYSIKFLDGIKIESMSYRLVGFYLKAKPGTKRSTNLKLS
jgi:hypothetical protein